MSWNLKGSQGETCSCELIELVDEGVRHSVRVGNVIDFQIKDLVAVRRRDRRAGRVPLGSLRA